ncbi:hypothetical protein [Micrococcus luteus]|uniref:hypothetical protein n=1 Tax=Micrococcus luteus TaxID=1270 RepID=UPI003330D660
MVTYLINIWDLIHDPDVPADVVQRAFARQRAKAVGLPVPEIPAEDLPHLARHARPASEVTP